MTACLRGLPFLIAAIGFACGSRSLDPGGSGGTGGVATGTGGTSGSGGGGRFPDGGWGIDLSPPQNCGNGILDPGEQCDDGQLVSGDGCSRLCQIECYRLCGTCGTQSTCISSSGCGNGFLEPGETCDDGNVADGDGCSSYCNLVEPGWSCPAPGRRCVPICGDGIVLAPESCDDGNTIAGDGCSDICVVEPTTARCGDGIVEGDEECDEGAGDPTYGSGCTAACRFSGYCGDGIVNGPEVCDLGVLQNDDVYGGFDGCTPNCTLPHYCGDGIVDVSDGEQCDFGANNGQVATSCTVDCKAQLD